MFKFKFADIGEGLHEGVVGEIYVKKGDKIKEGDSLFSVETDKVTSDIPSPVDGTVSNILIKTGETVHVGDVTMDIDDGSKTTEALEPKAEASKEEKSAAPKEEESASVVGDIKVSNNVFSFDSFKSTSSKPAASPAKAITAAPTKSNDQGSGFILPDVSKITPKGDGEKVDVVVIGAGPGGYELSSRLGKQGLKVVNIEDSFAGGVCLNIGCIPTKALLKGAKVYSYMKHSAELGIVDDISKIKINWKKMQERKVGVCSTLEKGVEFLLKSSKVQFIKGRGTVLDQYNVEVNGKVFTTKFIIVASGSRPVALTKLPGFQYGYDKKTIVDSTGALAFSEIPKKLAIIGGGVIGVEFAVLFNELGSKVTILEGASEILAPMDGAVKTLTNKLLIDNGIDIKLNIKVTKFDNNQVIYEDNGKEVKLPVDKLLVSVGRIPNNLDIDKSANVKLGKRGEILVNDIMQTNIPNIFAIGDVVGHAMLAHTAYKHAAVVAKAFEGVVAPYNRNQIPGCVYIYPEISSIGKTEEELKAEGTDYLVSEWKNKAVGRALAENDTLGFTKLLFDPKYGVVLGAHLINASSSEMIAEISTLMNMEGTVYELADTVHPHPSTSEGIWEAATHAVEKLKKLKNR